MVNLFFTLLSIAYVSAIFLLADSPAVSAVAPYNPFSLLHIPLYGIMTILILLSIVPFDFSYLFRVLRRGENGHQGLWVYRVIASIALKPNIASSTNSTNSINSTNPINPMNTADAINSIDAMNPRRRFLIAGLISLAVAIADEYHQLFIPIREGSLSDVLLDVMGIVLALLLISQFHKRQIKMSKR
jgi:hypothetical protein